VGGLETVHSLASRVARDWVNFGRIRPLDELLSGIQNVTADDVQRVMAAYLKPEKRTVIHVIAPPDDASVEASVSGETDAAASGEADAPASGETERPAEADAAPAPGAAS